MRSGSVLKLTLLLAASTSVSTRFERCYSVDDSAALGEASMNDFNSIGLCRETCFPLGSKVVTVQDMNCWCIDAADIGKEVDDDLCSSPCPGYPEDKCASIFLLSLLG